MKRKKKRVGYVLHYYVANKGNDTGLMLFFSKSWADKKRKYILGKEGALCSEPRPVMGEQLEKLEILKAQQGNFVKGLLKKFETCLRREVAVVCKAGNKTRYNDRKEFERRMKGHVRSNNPRPTRRIKDMGVTAAYIKKHTLLGKAYRYGVIKVLRQKIEICSVSDTPPAMAVSRLLEDLAKSFSNMK
jgi:hypothetical protein